MNGRITIDGYYKREKEVGYELIHHGGHGNLEALCSLNYSIHHIPEVIELLEHMIDSLKGAYAAELAGIVRRKLYGERLNEQLIKAGHKPFTQEQIDVIYYSKT